MLLHFHMILSILVSVFSLMLLRIFCPQYSGYLGVNFVLFLIKEISSIVSFFSRSS